MDQQVIKKGPTKSVRFIPEIERKIFEVQAFYGVKEFVEMTEKLYCDEWDRIQSAISCNQQIKQNLESFKSTQV